MIFSVRRATGFPIIMEPDEEYTLHILEKQGKWQELEDFERQLRTTEFSMRELNIECSRLEEVLVFLKSLYMYHPITIDFRKRIIIIEDNGDREVQ